MAAAAADSARGIASWPKGFAGNELRRKEFVRYLDELVGLGVLHRSGDRYGIRSPNVIALLGTKDALDQELREMLQRLAHEPRTTPGT